MKWLSVVTPLPPVVGGWWFVVGEKNGCGLFAQQPRTTIHQPPVAFPFTHFLPFGQAYPVDGAASAGGWWMMVSGW